MVKKLICFLSIFLIFLSPSFPQQSDTKKNQEIQSEISRLIKILGSADLSFCLLSPEGEQVVSYNSKVNLIPASTLKIYTSGAVLNLLGDNFQFKTFLEYDGHIDNCGVLHGNIFIRGSGDPSLASERFEGYPGLGQLVNKFGDEIKSFGITQIKGNIIGDNSYLLDCLTPESWPYTDRGNYYGAEPSGLNVAENTYKLFFKPGKSVGSKTELIGTDPPDIPGLFLKNEVTTYYAGSGDRALIESDPYNLTKKVQGTIPAGVSKFFIKGSIPDPAHLLAKMLLNDLINKGVSIEGESSTIYKNNRYFNVSKTRQKLYTHLSPPLLDIVLQVNMKSHNLFAETLLLDAGKIFMNIGNYENGQQVVSKYWESKGIDMEKAELFDGCGLSPLNKISSQLLAEMLLEISNEEIFNSFINTLPVAGESGTLKNFCKNTSAKGRIFAKSGSISGVRSYAGYAFSRSGRYFPFALIVNNYSGSSNTLTNSLERLMEAIANIR